MDQSQPLQEMYVFKLTIKAKRNTYSILYCNQTIIDKMNEFYNPKGMKVTSFKESGVYVHISQGIGYFYFLFVEYGYADTDKTFEKKWTPTFLQITSDLQTLTAYPFPTQ